MNVVFCGSSRGRIRSRSLRRVQASARAQKVDDLVRFLGYVPEEEIPALYAGSSGLVMPSLFGPTNLPVLEAWRAGKPVIAADIEGVREQVGDAGFLVDPLSADSIASAMDALWRGGPEIAAAIERGRACLALADPKVFRERLRQVLEIVVKRYEGVGPSRMERDHPGPVM